MPFAATWQLSCAANDALCRQGTGHAVRLTLGTEPLKLLAAPTEQSRRGCPYSSFNGFLHFQVSNMRDCGLPALRPLLTGPELGHAR